MARKPNQNNAGQGDDAWSWEAREYLRKLLVGKSVLCTVSHTIPSSGREYGYVLIGNSDPEKAENVAVKLVSEGLARVRDNCHDPEFNSAQDAAKAAKKGQWSDEPMTDHIRNVTWEVENPRQLVDRFAGKPIDAIIENVRDGSTVRAFLLPDFYHVTLMMSGVRCPNVQNAEEYASEALYFTESRLLQREVQIILESVNNKNFVGTIVHPNGNIAEALLREGLAKCVDWSLAIATEGPEKYRKAQASAKEAKKRIWKNYDGPSGPQLSARDKEFTGKVVEIVNGDAIMVKKNKTETKKIFLASMKPPPRPEGLDNKIKPLYDIPFMFEAREFLRKKLIGQNVHVIVDYVQPASTDASGRDYPEKICGTITIGGVNVAEALVSKGLASVVRHKHDDDERSSHYNDLLSAEEKAKKSNKGMYSKNAPNRRITDMAGDVNKSKQFLPFLQRAGRMQAVVEFVASGSRFRVYIPRETCVITFLLAGISCPRAGRTMPGGIVAEAEPWGDEAMAFVKEMILQREVEIEVEQIGKGGNFIGWCFVDNTNISVALVEGGYASSHFTAEKSNYGRLIAVSEENAKRSKEKRWANYVEAEVKDDDEEKDDKKDEAERKVKYETVVITEVTDEAHVYAQHVDEGPKLVNLMNQLREEFSQNPPLAGAYTPKRGETCAAKFVDNEWYRVKVEKMTSATECTVLYMDYGNKATIPKAKCGSLPASFHGLPAFAKEYALAFMTLAPDEDYAASGIQALKEDLLDRKVKINTEYKDGNLGYVTVFNDSNDDLGKSLVQDGLMMVDKVRGRRLAKVVNSYVEAQESAKKNHLNIWEYGDITGDEAREFGAPPPRA